MASGLTRRDFLRACSLGAAGLGLASRASSVRAAKTATPALSTPPNVLFIMQDQLRYPAWFLDTDRLPGLNRLRNEGVWFTNHFTCAAPCSPSRACIQTGLHITQHGLRGNVVYDIGSRGLPASFHTLGHRFQAAGYRTPYFGKWHLSSASMLRSLGNTLAAYGYEDWFAPDYVDKSPDGIDNDPTIAGQAQSWLAKHGPEGPWFLTCSLLNPHDIDYCPGDCVDRSRISNLVTQLPPNFDDSLLDKPRVQLEHRQSQSDGSGIGPETPERQWLDFINSYCYYAQAVDQQVDTLLDTLESLGLSTNTLVVFTTDHGEMGGSHQLTSKGPFMYQESVKVPLALRLPGHLVAGQEISGLSQSVDIVPTLCELTGLGAPGGLPGKSLKPLISFEDEEINDANPPGHTNQEQGQAAANVNSHVLYAYGAQVNSPNPDSIPRQIRAVFNGRYKYGLYFDSGVDSEEELYDLDNDPYELTNLAHEKGYATVKARMSSLLAQARHNEMGESV